MPTNDDDQRDMKPMSNGASFTRSESVASSEDSGGSDANLEGLNKSAHRNGDDDDDDDEGQGTSFIAGVFGVIYTVSREKKVSLAFVVFKLLMDALQLLLLTINPQYGFQIKSDSTWWYVISFVQLNAFMTSRGFTFFLACLYTFVFMLAMTVVLSLWVAWSFKNNRFDFVWPITFLKWFADIFFQVLDIASMTLFLITLDCQYNGSTDPAIRFHNQEFPERYCWEMPYMIHAAVSAIAVIVFVVMAAAFQMGDMETNPLHLNPLAEGHSMIEVTGFLLKFFMTASSVFINNLRWLAVSYIVCSLALAYLYVKWVPHYTAWVNWVRAGTYSAILYSAVVMGAMVIPGVVDNGSTEEIYSWNKACSIALVAGLVPAALLGGLAAYLRLHYFAAVVNRYKQAGEGADPELVHKFTDAREVEIAARCCRRWLDPKTVDPEAIELAHTIIKAGSKLLSEAYMHILHSSFNVDVQHSMQTGLARLQAAKKADPSVLDRFAIFSREQQQTQRYAGLDNGHGADLLSYVQMQRSLRLATKVYKRCMVTMCEFWTTLVEKEVQFEALLKCVARIDESIKSADDVYRDIISESLDNWRLLRIYARYLETIKNDPWNSAKWHAEADHLRASAEEAQTNVITTVSMLGVKDETAAEIRDSLDSSKAAFLVNAEGVILLANKTAVELFGYSRPQLHGSNISIIMPSPFKEQHDKYLKRYTDTDASAALGHANEVVAQHADGHDFPVTILVTKVSGMSLDSLFLGFVEPLASDKPMSRVWVMADNSIFGADYEFTDWFGYQKSDILKQPFSDYVQESKEMDRVLKTVRDADVVSRVTQRRIHQSSAHEQMKASASGKYASGTLHEDSSVYAGEQGVIRMKDVHMRHCYSDSVECNLKIRYAGLGNHRFFIMEIMRPVTSKRSHMMLVVDSTGRVRHATQDLAEMLGITVKELTTIPQVAAAAGGAGRTSSPVYSLDAILPDAFAALHIRHLASPIDTRLPPPPFSCRSGLAVCMSNRKGDGPPLLPFQLRVTSKAIAVGVDFLAKQETMHIVNLTPRTMEEALDERRLSFFVDLDGKIQRAFGSAAVFGFDPRAEIGSSIGNFLDMMMSDREQGEQDECVSNLLKDLCTRSVLQPGCSFRVGVVPPVQQSELERFGSLMTSFVRDKIKIPAVMEVTVTWSDAGGVGAKLSGHSSPAALEQAPSGMTSRMGTIDEEEAPPAALIQISLWKSSVMTAVLHLDDNGIITDTCSSVLSNPGHIFGFDPLDLMQGKHIGDVLSMGSHSVADLFKPQLGGAGKSSTLKSGMKSSMTTKASTMKSGPINELSATHLDGGELVLRVQATHLKGGVSVVLHISKPSLGMPGFQAWLSQSNMEMQQGPSDKAAWRPRSEIGSVQPLSGDPSLPSQLERSFRPVPSMPMLQLTKTSTKASMSPKGKRASVTPSNGDPTGPSRQASQASEGKPSPWEVQPLMLTLEELASELQEAPVTKKQLQQQCAAVSFNQQLPVAQVDRHSPPSQAVEEADWRKAHEGSGDEDAGSVAQSADYSDDADTHPKRTASQVEMWAKSAEFGPPPEAAETPTDRLRGSDAQILVKAPLDFPRNLQDKTKHGSESGSEAESSKQDNAGLPSVTAMDAGFSGDYRRGKRFKRLSRLLGASAVQQAVSRFQFRALAVVCVVLATTISCFTVADILINQQNAKVTNIQDTGSAANAISLMTVDVQNMILLFPPINFSSPGLLHLTSVDTDVPYHLERLRKNALEFKSKLSTTYDFVSQLPRSGSPMYANLSSIWFTNSLNISMILYSHPNTTMDYYMMNLWDAGGVMISKALDIYQNAMTWEDRVPEGTAFYDWSDVRCLLDNTPDIIIPAITATMDVMLSVVVDEASKVNSIHIYFLIIEGVVCCVAALLAVYICSTQVVLQRWNTYNTFMVVPIGILKALATKSLQNITSGDDDTPTGLPQDDVFLDDGKGAINLTFRGKEPSQETSALAVVKAALGSMAFWKKGKHGNKIVPFTGHSRRMVRSSLTVVLFMAPFAAWGLIMIIINQLAHSQLSLVANPIALFNLVNYNLVNFYRYYSFMQALVIQPDPSKMDGMRAYLQLRYDLMISDYTAMLRGASAVNDTSPHVALVSQGLSSGVGNDILYTSTDCMCLDQSDCVPRTHHLYQTFHHGLDAMLQRYFEVIRTSINDGGLNPLNSSAEFEYMVEGYPDIEGGLVQLVQVNFQFVTQQYQLVLKTHIMALIVTLLLMAAFVLLLLRPFVKETRAEPKRLAELLSQLPQDVNIEAFVKTHLLEKNNSAAASSM